MNTQTKKWWTSRTIWVQIIAVLFALGAGFEWWPKDITQEEVVAAVMGIVAVVTFILRLRTTETIKKEGVVAPLVKKDPMA